MRGPKRHALVKGGKVVDLVMPGPGWLPPKGVIMVVSDTANIGDRYNDGKFVAPPVEDNSGDCLYIYRHNYAADVVEFNLANPGDDTKIIKIQINDFCLNEIRDLAWLAETTGEDIVLATNKGPLTLSPEQIKSLYKCIAEHIHRNHKAAAQHG